jgi:uncharacterized protein YcbX
MPRLAAITVYPLKSFTGQPAREALVLPSGALEHDRRFAFVDDEGKFWNGKRSPRVHGLRTWLAANARVLTLHDEQQREQAWHIDDERATLEAWFTARFGGPVRLTEESTVGFPDDHEAPGPTLVSTASLELVAGWFPTLTVDDVRARFRANLEIDGVEPFWEDRLFGTEGSVTPFRIGPLIFGGTNPCQRCVVPTRDVHTGDVTTGFQKTFAERRAATLPSWAAAERFNHFYRFTLNTRPLSGTGQKIAVGDEVEIIH